MTLDEIDRLTAEASRSAERALLRAVLVECDWVQARAAESLRCSTSTLSDRLARHPTLLAERQEHGVKHGRKRKSA